MVKVRAKINKIDNKTLSIAEVPFGKTVPGVCDSIVKASEKGKIKIRKVEDLTSEKVEILVLLEYPRTKPWTRSMHLLIVK